ncbi:MAG: stage V sporulation protein S [Ruminiclostridium sp.]|nr:stage V sporulation protein S [Ruminiclostridium sp.]
MEIVKVSARSVPKSVAGAIAAVIREKNEVEVQAVGAGALNQAVKSIAIARSYMALTGVDIVCIPAFTTVDIDGEERTAMKFVVEVR